MNKAFKPLLKIVGENKKLDKLKNLLDDYYDIDAQIKADAVRYHNAAVFGMRTAFNISKKKNVETALQVIPSEIFKEMGISKKDCLNPIISCSCIKYETEPKCVTKKMRLFDSIYIGDDDFICYNCYYKRYRGTYISLPDTRENRVKCSDCNNFFFTKGMLSDPLNKDKIYCSRCFLEKFKKQITAWKKDNKRTSVVGACQ